MKNSHGLLINSVNQITVCDNVNAVIRLRDMIY